MRRKLELIESSPSASAESWREETPRDEREELRDDKEAGDEYENDISDMKPGQSENDELLAR